MPDSVLALSLQTFWGGCLFFVVVDFTFGMTCNFFLVGGHDVNRSLIMW